MKASGRVRVSVEGEHRDSICENCEVQMTMKEDASGVARVTCGKCGGFKGRIIARSVQIQSPEPPNCTSPSCLWKFFLDTLYNSLLSRYHCRRVEYAERKRHKRIPMKYRTGSPAPENIRQAVLAIIILKLRR